MSGTAQSLMQARLTGRPVPIQGVAGLFAYPNGNLGPPPGGGFGGSGASPSAPALPIPPVPPAQVPPAASAFPPQPVAPSAPLTTAGVQGAPGSPSGPAVTPPAPSGITNRPVGSTVTWPPPWWPTGGSAPQTQPALDQANPNFTAGIQGLPGSPSGPAVAPPGGFPPPHVPDVVVTAKRYRQAHGLATSDDAATDQLNAASLAAAQAGRNYLPPGPYPGGAVNALTMPPTTQQPTQQVAQNLLQQGIY
jgi:hypothetical protein